MALTTSSITTTGNVAYVSIGNTAVTWLSLNNWGPANVTANVFVVPSGNTPGTTNQVYYSLLLQSGDTFQIYSGSEKLVLSNGDGIAVSATSNTVTSVTSYTPI